MIRSTVFITLSALLAFTMSSADYSQPKPNKPKKTVAKKSDKTAESTNKTEGVIWYNMTEGYAKAKKEKKVLVVDMYTDWCYWCKVMDQNTYVNPAIIKKMKSYCVAVKFNPEVEATHTVNDQTMSSSQLMSYLNRGGRSSGYPTTYFWKKLGDNSKISSYPGYKDTAQFNEILNKIIQEQ